MQSQDEEDVHRQGEEDIHVCEREAGQCAGGSEWGAKPKQK